MIKAAASKEKMKVIADRHERRTVREEETASQFAEQDAVVAEAILRIALDLGVKRMPTYSEILKYEGKSTLNVKIAASGGTKVWAARLGLSMSDPDEIGVCEICGRQFNRRKPQERYCSSECRKEAFCLSSKQELVCPVCGKKFIKTSKNQKYCCPEHAERQREERKQERRRNEKNAGVKHTAEVCRRKKTCKYGAQLSGFWYCDYLSMEGKSHEKKGRECVNYVKREEAYSKIYNF